MLQKYKNVLVNDVSKKFEHGYNHGCNWVANYINGKGRRRVKFYKKGNKLA